MDVDAPPDIIVVDEDDDIIDEEDPIAHDLADFDDEDLLNLDIYHGVRIELGSFRTYLNEIKITGEAPEELACFSATVATVPLFEFGRDKLFGRFTLSVPPLAKDLHCLSHLLF
uniref:Uncharacterized protein n=1 Tax=Tanacetum cinerariifolium TaxID=118510 RepID=A0A6L2KQU5_TANCI|nr:hypothetical protein [Tanacetum cinerariifolium]